MPLKRGSAEADISANIAELIKAGHPDKQAQAIAYKVAGKDCGALDMEPEDWDGLLTGLAKFFIEEEEEPEHQAQDAVLAMDKALDTYDPVTGKRIVLADRFAMDKATSVRSYDPDGRLRVGKVHVSKSNCCPYWGHEIPDYEALGLQPDRKYILLRDPEELAKAAQSSNGIPLLLGHTPVSPDDHSPEVVVGAVGTDAEFNDPYLDNSLIIWTREGIDAVESGKAKELSCAYRYVPVMEPGVYKGAPFDGRMTQLSFNHLALVEEGRAGADVVIGDAALSYDWSLIEEAILGLRP